MKTKVELFYTGELYWRDSDKKQYKEIIDLLNTLPEEVQNAIKLYGQSKYDEGNANGYSDGVAQYSDDY
jgi:hypothetical protein